MPKQVTVTLGGRSYAISEKPMGINGAWRKKLRATSVMQLFESLDGLVDDLVVAIADVRREKIESADEDGNSVEGFRFDIGKMFAVLRNLPTLVNGLASSVDDIIDLLFDYEPKLRTERKWLEENAYDEEVIAAFIEVLKLTFPIMALWGLLSTNGSRAQQTATNSHSQNGASGLPASGPKSKGSRPKAASTS